MTEGQEVFDYEGNYNFPFKFIDIGMMNVTMTII